MTSKTAKVPKVSLEIWRQLYAAVEKFYTQAPWRWMTDDDVFGVYATASKQTLYCCTIGVEGHSPGLAIYRGAIGLALFRGMRLGEISPEDRAADEGLNALFLTLNSAKGLEDIDLEVSKKIKFKPKSDDAWPMFRSILPGHTPWPLNQTEALDLIDVLDVLEIHSLESKNRKKKSREPTVDHFNVYTKKGDEWTASSKDTDLLLQEPVVGMDRVEEPLNLVLLKEILEADLPQKGTWECDIFEGPGVLTDAERPYYPQSCCLIESKTLFCIGIDMVKPPADIFSRLANLFLGKVHEFGYIPKKITAESAGVIVSLGDLCSELGIELQMKPLKAALAFKNALFMEMEANEELM